MISTDFVKDLKLSVWYTDKFTDQKNSVFIIFNDSKSILESMANLHTKDPIVEKIIIIYNQMQN